MSDNPHVQVIEAAQFEGEVLASSTPVVLDFYSTECPPCEALAPKFEALADKYAGRVRFLKIFRQGNRELADKLGVTGSPTLVFFKSGKEIGERLTGEIQRSSIKGALDTLLS
ncbi:MAG: thioredoxin fold domain-containing protein [Deltaproteobacteria bacterium]|nr:thioredoxin fold domain-containing protein [Deltaproteobacteria bacterium]